MEITACPRCGSRNIFQGRLKDGVLTGYTSRDVCRNCGYRGSPIIFDSENEYKKFVEELKKEESSDESGDISDLSDKDKQILDDLKQLSKRLGAIFIKIDPDILIGSGVPGDPGAQEAALGGAVQADLAARGWVESAEQIQFRNTEFRPR